MATKTTWWLESKGTRRRVGPAGVLFGRSPSCDIVLFDEQASRKQALIYVDHEGPKLLVLGRGATTINGTAVTKESNLSPGDLVAVPGAEVVLAREILDTPQAEASGHWVLRDSEGSIYGVGKSPLVIGGDARADVQLGDLPADALRLHRAGKRLELEALAPTLVDGDVLEPGSVVELETGTEIHCGDVLFSVATLKEPKDVATLGVQLSGSSELPKTVNLEFLPRGGRLTLTYPTLEVEPIYLPDRRCDLVATLLNPPEPYAAGEHIPDEVVLPRVWPGKDMTRSDLNVLVHRVRKSLTNAGIDGARLVTRARGGGATSFRVDDGANVTVG